MNHCTEVTQPPDYKPASVLLERIRQQRYAQAAKTKGKPKTRTQSERD